MYCIKQLRYYLGDKIAGVKTKTVTLKDNTTINGAIIKNDIDLELTGLDAKDKNVITLSAIVTQADSGVNDYEVQFRICDKKGTGEVKGKYHFSLKK